ncbi:MAG: hypothetical protein JWO05_3735 [Gemmatimonadetes bacterium]|nr:hypothetical protein [Gemmatimonadota bacterium]
MRRRRGIALPIALLVLAVSSALLAAAWWTSLHAMDAARRTQGVHASAALVDLAISRTLAEWDTTARLADAVRGTVELGPVAGSSASARRWITRASATTWWLTVEAVALVDSGGSNARARSTAARRRAARIIEWRAPTSAGDSPLTVRGQVTSAADALVTATDADVPACDSRPVKPITATDTASSPPDSVGGLSWPELAARAGASFEAPSLDGRTIWCLGQGCVAPGSIVLVNGSTTMSEGSGTGILMVNGDLRLRPPFAFNGMIVVRGSVEAGAVHLKGALVASGPINLMSGFELQRSSCTLLALSRQFGRVAPVSRWGWIELP